MKLFKITYISGEVKELYFMSWRDWYWKTGAKELSTIIKVEIIDPDDLGRVK